MSEKSQKTICFFNSNRAWGGGEKWHFTTAREFQHRGYRTFLVANIDSELARKAKQEKLSCFTFYVHNLSFLNPFKILFLVSYFKKNNVHTIIMNLPSDLKLAGLAARLCGVKNIIYRRGMPHPLRASFLNKFLFKHVLTHIIINSEEIGRSLISGNESWFPQNKMVLIHNGVDTKLPLPPVKKLYQKTNDEVVLGNAGRLTGQKGQKYLILMAEILKKQHLKFKLLIAGEGELRLELQKQIDQLGLQNEVTLLGHVQDMSSFMNSLDVFVFPSLFEGSANTLIETLHHKVPSVAFNISSNPEIIEHGVNGLLAKPFDVSDLAYQVTKLIHSAELRENFIKKGSEVVREKFDSRKNLEKLKFIIG